MWPLRFGLSLDQVVHTCFPASPFEFVGHSLVAAEKSSERGCDFQPGSQLRQTAWWRFSGAECTSLVSFSREERTPEWVHRSTRQLSTGAKHGYGTEPLFNSRMRATAHTYFTHTSFLFPFYSVFLEVRANFFCNIYFRLRDLRELSERLHFRFLRFSAKLW